MDDRAPESGPVFSTFTFGTLGAGPGQSLNAKAAHLGCIVPSLTGDGAVGRHVPEVETAVGHRLPLVSVVLCDRPRCMVTLTPQVPLPALGQLLDMEGEGPSTWSRATGTSTR